MERKELILIHLIFLTAAYLTKTATSQKDCSRLVDLCFLVDISGSICDTDPSFHFDYDNTCHNWETVVTFIKNITSVINVGLNNTVRVALVTFGDRGTVMWNLTKYTDKQSLLQAVTNLTYIKSQITNTSDGLRVMNDQVFNEARPNADKLSIIITDGKPTNLSEALAAIQLVHNNGIKTYSIGITNAIDDTVLKNLSSEPKQESVTYFKAINFAALDETLIRPLQAKICTTESARTFPSSTFPSSTITTTFPTPSTVRVTTFPVTTSSSTAPAACTCTKDEDWILALIVGLTVGVPLLAIIAILAGVIGHMRRKEQGSQNFKTPSMEPVYTGY